MNPHRLTMTNHGLVVQITMEMDTQMRVNPFPERPDSMVRLGWGTDLTAITLSPSCGDNPNGNNPDLFPSDSAQCGDRDGDGYGDNPSGKTEIGSRTTRHNGGMKMEMDLVKSRWQQLRYLPNDVWNHEYRRSPWMP
ncbi:MAG: hypothetical protein Ct9H90mP16_14090 [Candidatus Poseidoniales archaeon]|nr:MAG: hypothetical protein Ct9H90mP16_14090 [Candidatus Poseidoniales archaeon]